MSQEFITYVRVQLAKHNKTQAWLADQIDISRPYMSDIMKGRRSPESKIPEIKAALESLEVIKEV
ncbi:helix-turn-helix domain-containing protein [Enterococcus wangshanyuanii]|uniref:Transcriptional regulator n=1 Tax=Enterococcus wangshanyuanii TaxID=2005703 RepID=A0ABQ1NHZ5_9ENTE|nr:helix-turn-helix transcriptional regulator [Enterococcus wangshanyuanii]GGC74706.1 transcriptional regulator [Enterococcus wangshanyuanii]